MNQKEVLIIGGGIAGLSAAIHLQRAGLNIQLLEATERVGGRVKTDLVDGFRLDRGFQVLLTAYPEAQALLDYKALDLRYFKPGAYILDGSKQFLVGDPMRWLGSTWGTLFNSVGTFNDKLKVLSLRQRLNNKSLEAIFDQPEISTRAALQQYGFSTSIIEKFFQPFLRGIFLEKDLSTSRRMFDFVFKLFSKGGTALPAKGIEAIPQQLAAQLATGVIECGQKVMRIDEGKVITEEGKIFTAKKILMATNASVVENITPEKKFHATTNLYFSSSVAPFKLPILYLNPDKDALVNNLCSLSALSEQFAPAGKHLISVSIIGLPNLPETQLVNAVKVELKQKLGKQVTDWQHIKTYYIQQALPNLPTLKNDLNKSAIKLNENLYQCGDYLLNGSLNAAMKSGRLAAEAIITDVNG